MSLSNQDTIQGFNITPTEHELGIQFFMRELDRPDLTNHSTATQADKVEFDEVILRFYAAWPAPRSRDISWTWSNTAIRTSISYAQTRAKKAAKSIAVASTEKPPAKRQWSKRDSNGDRIKRPWGLKPTQPLPDFKGMALVFKMHSTSTDPDRMPSTRILLHRVVTKKLPSGDLDVTDLDLKKLFKLLAENREVTYDAETDGFVWIETLADGSKNSNVIAGQVALVNHIIDMRFW